MSRARAKTPELMAPAGSVEAGLAALAAGADAIYLGLPRFSARADAASFDLDQLAGILGLAHTLVPRRRVFAAVNTLVLDRELAEVGALLGALADLEIDAVIVQDLGVARLCREHFPALRLHASTQMAVHNPQGVEVLARLGFARATLARELTGEELRACAAVPGIEVEAFVHGALCYAYSGLCLFSSQLLGRSGNRGQCAYPCRDGWRVLGGGPGWKTAREPGAGFAFSMKDLALADQVVELCATGVDSLKIEGRKKGPEYVAATVGLYRRLLDGELDPEERAAREADIQTIFSRPWTPLYFGGHSQGDAVDPDWVGHRGTAVGEVEAVVRAGKEVRVRFCTRRELGRHDGLQIDIPGRGRPFGFAVAELFLVGERAGAPRLARQAVEVPAGARVEVTLPEGYPTIPVGARVYCSSSQAVKKRYRVAGVDLGRARRRWPLAVELELDPEGMRLRGEASVPGQEPVVATLDRRCGLGPALDPDMVDAACARAFERLGQTRLALSSLVVHNPHHLYAPASLLNFARRALAEAVEREIDARAQERAARLADDREPRADGRDPSAVPASAVPTWSLAVDRVGSLTALDADDLAGLAELMVAIDREPLAVLEPALLDLGARLGPERLRLALPAITRGWEQRGLAHKVTRLWDLGFRRWQVAGLAGFAHLDVAGSLTLGPPGSAGVGEGGQQGAPALELTADWTLSTLNRAAAWALLAMGCRGVTLSPEDGLANLSELLARFAEEATIVVYQDTPLFISETCPWASLAGGCPGAARCDADQMRLGSHHGAEVWAINDRCRSVVVNAAPFCIVGRLDALVAAGVRHLRADFIWRAYAPEELRDRWRELRAGRPPGRFHEAGILRCL